MRAQACNRLSSSWALLCPVPTEKEEANPGQGRGKLPGAGTRAKGRRMTERNAGTEKARDGRRRRRGGTQKGTGREARQAELSLAGLGLTLRAASSDSFFSRFFSSRGNFS